MVIDYAAPGPLTSLDGVDPALLADLPLDPVGICAPVHAHVIQPHDATGLPSERFDEKQIRPAAAIVARLVELDPSPLTVPRSRECRVIGTCRHFTVLSCALLRYRGIPARARCGFATYFQPGKGLDHWVVEYLVGDRWVRMDTEIMGKSVLEHPEDLQPGQFLTGGEAWQLFRRGEIDAGLFGVYGTENWGPAEIQGNAVRDLAALNKVEMLPWDEWGRMVDAYQGKTGADYDAVMDAIAATDDPASLYRHELLRVPEDLYLP